MYHLGPSLSLLVGGKDMVRWCGVVAVVRWSGFLLAGLLLAVGEGVTMMGSTIMASSKIVQIS